MNSEKLISFERRVADLWEAGELPYLTHLSGGNESQLIDLMRHGRFGGRAHKPGDWVFSTHRNHYHALLAGVSEEKLMETIKRGDSMFVFDREKNFVTSAILAGNCCMAAGVAWQLKQDGSDNMVWCFVGDGAEENGHFYEAVVFVESKNLPCLFIVEDNGRQVDTDITTRRGNLHQHTRFPLQQFNCVIRYGYTPTWPHAGSGCKHKIEFKKR